jgi:hypothetical protein
LKSFHRFALVFLFLIAAAALQGTAADDKPVAFWGVWDFLDGGLLSRSFFFLYWRRTIRCKVGTVTWMGMVSRNQICNLARPA